MQMSLPAPETRPREQRGWRKGRPIEDPAKTKRWGFVTAKPSEFLVHCRRGAVLPSSGQGATCFKWPWDSVCVVPTSLQRVGFVADQVTRERVGVSITGLAVYRVAEPLLAYRVLNFSYPERAQEKLAETLTDMLVGATRRIVATLSVDECLEKRKAALAEELLREIAPVLGGEGRPEDRTDRGWGLVLDNVEIQEVRVLSDAVFANMQAPYRAALERRAREAEIETNAAVAAREAEVQRATLERRSEHQVRARELELREEEGRAADELRRRQLRAEAAEADVANHELDARASTLKAELEQLEFKAWLEKRELEAELEAKIGLREAEVARARAAAELEAAAAKAKVITAERLPELAGAVGARFGEVKVTQIGGEGTQQNPFGAVAQALAAVLELARDQS